MRTAGFTDLRVSKLGAEVTTSVCLVMPLCLMVQVFPALVRGFGILGNPVARLLATS